MEVCEGYLRGIFDGCDGYMRGKGDGCLATELQAIMGPCEAWGGLHNANQAIFLKEMVVILNFFHVFDE